MSKTIREQHAARTADFNALCAELDAKGTNVSDADLQRLKTLTAEVTNLANEVRKAETAEAKAFMKSLGGDAGKSPLSGIGGKAAWGAEVATRLTKSVGEFGVKALSTGGIDVPQVIESAPVAMPIEPTRVLDLLINRKPLEGNTFSYLQQTARSNAAAPVADGGTKPTSTYTFEDVEDRARVFAHLSEAFPQRYLDDHEEIRSILASQMAEDLYAVIEEEALIGDGTGEHFTGLATVTGVRAVAYSNSVLETLRKARTTLTTAGESPTAWVMNWADLEAIDLTREDGTTGGFMAGIDDKVFGNLPRVGTSLIPAGTAYLGDWSQTRLYVRDGGRLDADMSGTLFDTNKVKLRYEGRFGFAVLRPAAFAEIDLTSA